MVLEVIRERKAFASLSRMGICDGGIVGSNIFWEAQP